MFWETLRDTLRATAGAPPEAVSEALLGGTYVVHPPGCPRVRTLVHLLGHLLEHPLRQPLVLPLGHPLGHPLGFSRGHTLVNLGGRGGGGSSRYD